MARRLSAIRFAPRLRDLPDPTDHARVVAVWEGIRRTHSAPTAHPRSRLRRSCLPSCSKCWPKTSRTRGRPPEPDLGGLRDRALLLVGSIAALRRSELAALATDDVVDHPNGLVLSLRTSKTNQTGARPELVVLPRSGNPDRYPVTTLRAWTEHLGPGPGVI